MPTSDRQLLQRLIAVAQGSQPADTVLKNCHIIDVYNQTITTGDIAIVQELLAGVGGTYHGTTEFDASGLYASPGLIDGHIHIESSYLSPEEFGKLVVPCGTTTIIADPHEIVNVCGLNGLKYMLAAAQHTALDIRYMVPSCVPATDIDHAGAVLGVRDIATALTWNKVLGLGELMDYPHLLQGQPATLDKLAIAHAAGQIVDGHAPGLLGLPLSGYAAAGILTDHECDTPEGLRERVASGMYVLLRNGSACHDLPHLVPGVTPANLRRCLLCSDDLHPETIFAKGHLNEHLRLCVQGGLTPLQALTMATLNAAECYRLLDRGALTPGRRADLVLFADLQSFTAVSTWIGGRQVAKNGEYLLPLTHADPHSVNNTMHVSRFSQERLRLHLRSAQVHTIDIAPGSVVTNKGTAHIQLDAEGDFVYDPQADIVKLAVVERHKELGTVGLGLLRHYGLKKGALATSIAHDSHNLIVAGTNNGDMALAIHTLIQQQGGIVLTLDGKVLASLELPLAGLMSDQCAVFVNEQLQKIMALAYGTLGVNSNVDPIMTLCFMSLPVIPKLKLLDSGLFDVESFSFINLEA